MQDSGVDAVAAVKEMHNIVTSMNGGKTRVFVASIREASLLATLSASGLDTFTFSPQIADALAGSEPLTEAAVRDFEAAVVASGRFDGAGERGVRRD
jgi:transaldolase